MSEIGGYPSADVPPQADWVCAPVLDLVIWDLCLAYWFILVCINFDWGGKFCKGSVFWLYVSKSISSSSYSLSLIICSNSAISSLYFSFSFFCITSYLTRSSLSFSWVWYSYFSSAFFLIKSLFSLSILWAMDVISSKLCCISFSRSFKSPSWSPLNDF